MRCLNVAGALQSLKGMTLNSKRPSVMQEAVLFLFSSATSTCQYPLGAEPPCSSQRVQCHVHVWQWVSVLLGHLIQSAVIHAEPGTAVLFVTSTLGKAQGLLDFGSHPSLASLSKAAVPLLHDTGESV